MSESDKGVCWCATSDTKCPHNITSRINALWNEMEAGIDQVLENYDRRTIRRFLKKDVTEKSSEKFKTVYGKQGTEDVKKAVNSINSQREKEAKDHEVKHPLHMGPRPGTAPNPVHAHKSPGGKNKGGYGDKARKPLDPHMSKPHPVAQGDFFGAYDAADDGYASHVNNRRPHTQASGMSKSNSTTHLPEIKPNMMKKLDLRMDSDTPLGKKQKRGRNDEEEARMTTADASGGDPDKPNKFLLAGQGMGMSGESAVAMGLLRIADFLSRKCLPWQAACCPRAVEQLRDIRMTIIQGKHADFVARMKKQLEDKVIQFLAKKDEEVDFWMQKEVNIWTEAMGQQEGDQTSFFQSDLQRITDRVSAQEGSASHREVALAQALDEKERDNTRDQLIRFRKLCRNPGKMADADTRALHASFESAEGKVAANETIHARDIAKHIESAHEWLCCLADNALTAASSESVLSGMFDTLEVEKDRAMKSMRSAMDTYTAQHNSILDAVIEFCTRIHRHAQDYLSREQLISRAFLQYLMSVISGEIKPHTNDVRRSSIAWEGKFTNDRAHRMDQNLNKEFNVVLMPFDKLVDDLRHRMVKQLEFVTIKMQGMLNGREQDINKRKADIHKKLALHVNKACNNRRKKLKNHSAHERNESALEEKSLGAINDTTMELRTAVDQIWIKEHMKERRMYEAADGRMDRLKKSALVIWKKHSHLALAQKEEYDDWLKLYRKDRDETCADRRKEMDLSWLSWREDFGDRCKKFRGFMRPKFRMYLKRALDYDATVPIDTNIKDLRHLTGLVLTTFQTGVSNLRREMQTYIDKELKETDEFLKVRRDLLIQEWQDNLFRLNDAVNRRVSKLKDTEGDLEETLRLTMVQHEIESIVFEQSSCSRMENFWLNSREKIAAIGRDLKDTQAQMIALKGGEKKKTKNDRQIDAMMSMPDQKQTMKGAKQKGTNFKFDHTEKVEGVTFNNGCQFVDTFSMKRLLDEIRSDFYRNFVHKLVKIFEVVKKEHGVGKKRYLPAYLVSKVLFQMITEFWDVARFTDKCVGRFVYNGEVLFQDGLPLHARAIFVISTTITLMSEVSFVGNPNKCLIDVEHITDLIDQYQKKYFLVGLIMIVLKINSFGENFLKSEVMWACASCAIPPPAELFKGKQEVFTGISTDDAHKQKDGGANATNEFMLQFHHTTGYHMEDPIDLYNSILQIGEVDWQDESMPHPRGTESVVEGVEEAKAPFNTKPKYMKEEPKCVDTEALFSAVGSVFPSVDLIILASLLGRPDNQFEVTTHRFCQAVAFWRRISIAIMVAGTDCPGAEYNRCDDLIQTHTISRDAKKRTGYANIACASPFEAVAAVLDWMTSIKSVPISVLQAFSIFVRGGSVDPWLEDPKQSRRGARFAYELGEFLEIFVKCKDYQSESEPIAATINEKVIDTLNQFDIQGSGVIPTEVLRSYTKKLDPDFSSTQVTACFWSLSRGRGVENDLVRLTEVMHTPPEHPAPVSVKDVGGPATEVIDGDGDDEVKSVDNASEMGDQQALARLDDLSVISAIQDTEYAEGLGGEVEAYMEADLKREANDNDGGLQAVALQVQADRAASAGVGASITGGDVSVMGKSVAEGSTFGLDRYESTGVVARPKPIDTVFHGDVPTYVGEFSKDVNAYLTAAPSLDANVILGYLPGALNPSAAHELLSDAMRLDPSAKNVIPASVCMWMGARLVGTNEAIRSITEPRKEVTDLASKNAARIQSMADKGQAAVNTELHLGVRTWTSEVDALYEQTTNPDEARQYELSTYQRQLLHLLEMRMRIEIDIIIKYPQIVEQKNSDDHYGAAGGAPLDPKNHWNEVFDRRLSRIDKLTLAWRDTMMSEWANSLYQSRTQRYSDRSVVVHDCIAVYHDQYEELKHSIINERKELLLQYQKLDVELTDIIREDTGFMTYHGSFIDRLFRNVDGQMHRGLTIYEGALERFLKHCGAIKRRGLQRIEHANARLKEEMEKSCTGLIIGYTGGFAQGHFDELMYRGETWRKTVTQMHGDIIDEKEKFVHIKEESERDLAIQISDRITLDRARTKGLLDGLAEDTASIQEVVSNTRASYATIQKDANARLLIRIEKALRESRKLRAAAEESPDLETAVLREIRVVLNQAKTACDSIVAQIRDSSAAQLNNIEPLRVPHRAKMEEKIEGLEKGWKEVEDLLFPLIDTFEKNIAYKIGVLKANCIEGIGEFREKETRDLAREHAKQRRTLVEAFREHFTTYNLGEAAIFENFNYEVKDTAIEIKSMWGPTRPGFLKQAMNDMSSLVMESSSRGCKDVYATAFDHHSCTDDSILLRAELSDIVTHSLVDMQQTFNTIADHFEAEKWKVVKEIESMKMDENGDIVKPQIGAVMDLLLSAIEIDVDFRKGYDGLIKASEDKSEEASIELTDFLNRFQNPDVAGSLPHAIKNLISRIERRKEEVYSVIDAANKHVIADNTRMDVLLQAGFKDISEWETLTKQLVDNAFYNAEENYLATVFNTPPASPRLDELPPDEDRVGRIKGLVRAIHDPADLDHELDMEKTQRRNDKNRSRRSGKKDISSDILHKDDQIALKEIAESKPEKTKQLQQGWLECYSSEGYTYYYNPATRESLWDLPVALKVPLYDDDDVRVIETPRDIVAGEFYVQQEPNRMSTVKGLGDTTGSAQLKDRRLIMSELAENARAFAMAGLDTAVDVASVLRGIKRDVNPFTKPSGQGKDARGEGEREDDETLGNTTYVTSHGNETETEIDVNDVPPGAMSTMDRQGMINSKPLLSERMVLEDEKAAEPGDNSTKHPYAVQTQESEQKMIDHADADTASVVSQSLTIQQGFLNDALGGSDDMSVQTEQDKALEAALVMEALGVQPNEDDDTSVLLQEEETAAAKFEAEQAYHEARERDSMLSEMNRSMEVEDEFESMNKFNFNHKLVNILESKGVEQEQIDNLKAFSRKCKRITIIEELADHTMTWDKLQEMVFLTLAAKEEAKALEERLKTEQGRDRQKRILEHGEDVDEMAEFFKTDCKLSKTEARKCATECVLRKIFTAKKLAKFWFRNDINLEDDLGLDEDDAEDVAIQLRAIQAASTASIASLKSATSMLNNSSSNVNLLSKHASTPNLNLTQYQEDTQPEVWSYDEVQAQQQAQQQQEYFQGQLEAQQQQAAAAVAAASQHQYYDPNAVYYDEQGNAYRYDENGNATYDEYGVGGQQAGDGSQDVYYDEQGNAYKYDENDNAIYDDAGAGEEQYDPNAVYYDEQGNAYTIDENGNAVYETDPAITRAQSFSNRTLDPKKSWSEHRTDDGHNYYYNEVTGSSAWELPVGEALQEGNNNDEGSVASQSSFVNFSLYGPTKNRLLPIPTLPEVSVYSRDEGVQRQLTLLGVQDRWQNLLVKTQFFFTEKRAEFNKQREDNFNQVTNRLEQRLGLFVDDIKYMQRNLRKEMTDLNASERDLRRLFDEENPNVIKAEKLSFVLSGIEKMKTKAGSRYEAATKQIEKCQNDWALIETELLQMGNIYDESVSGDADQCRLASEHNAKLFAYDQAQNALRVKQDELKVLRKALRHVFMHSPESSIEAETARENNRQRQRDQLVKRRKKRKQLEKDLADYPDTIEMELQELGLSNIAPENMIREEEEICMSFLLTQVEMEATLANDYDSISQATKKIAKDLQEDIFTYDAKEREAIDPKGGSLFNKHRDTVSRHGSALRVTLNKLRTKIKDGYNLLNGRIEALDFDVERSAEEELADLPEDNPNQLPPEA